VYNNTVADSNSVGLYIHGGHGHIWKHNVAFNNAHCAFKTQEENTEHIYNNTITDNVMVSLVCVNFSTTFELLCGLNILGPKSNISLAI
jgi:hypothetical protein